MQKSFYIFDDEDEVIAIFKNEAFARDYLYYLGLNEESCRIGILSDNVFDFEQHDAKYHTLKDSSLRIKSHHECSRFRRVGDDIGYCFLRDEPVEPYEPSCSAIQIKK